MNLRLINITGFQYGYKGKVIIILMFKKTYFRLTNTSLHTILRKVFLVSYCRYSFSENTSCIYLFICRNTSYHVGYDKYVKSKCKIEPNHVA